MNRNTVGACVLVAVCGLSLGQPGGEPPQGERPREGQPGVDREGLKNRLQRRLEESRKNQERLEAALKKLDEGAEPGEVLREVDLPGRLGGRRDGRGPDGRGEMGPGGHGDGRPEGPMGRGEGPIGKPEGEDGGVRDTQPGAPLAAQDRERIQAFLAEHMPEFAERVESVRKVDPQTADRMILRLAPRIREAMGFLKRDPEMFKLRLDEMKGGIDVLEAVREYRAARAKPTDAPGRDQAVKVATDRLRGLLGAQFDLRTRVMQRDMEMLAKRLEEMKTDLEKRRAGRDAAIDDMLGKMGDGQEPRDIEPDGKRPPRRGGPPAGGG